MIERQKYMDGIKKFLTYITVGVKLENSLNFTNINIYSENFYRDFLNLLYSYKLQNINIIEKNTVAIDLGDIEQKKAFQVTSTSTLDKTKKTIDLFIKNKLYEKYEKLIILNITKKLEHREDYLGNNLYQLNTKKDIWDISNIIEYINDLSLSRIKEIYNFLKDEIKFVVDPTLSNEMQTFIALMKFLSDETHPSIGKGFKEDPDPNKKINERFSEHKLFLKKRFQELCIEYGKVLEDIIQYSDIGNVRTRRLGHYLKSESDEVLTNCNGNPKEALDILVNRYVDLLSNNQVQYDKVAIEFFLIDQLIKCNIFPNKDENHG